MRKLSFIFIIVFAFTINAPAQTSLAQRAFDKATQTAQAGQFEKALENYRKALNLSAVENTNDEFLARIHYNIGVCLYQLKRSAEAIEEFNKAIELSHDKYQNAFYALGMAQTELKIWNAAGTSLRKAVSLKKDDGEAWFDLALVLLEEKKFEAAREAFQNAIKYKSVAAADARNNIGVVLFLKGEVAAAAREFETALRESGGKSVEARNNLQFCKSYRQSINENQSRGIEFSKTINRID
jgi:Flp pilus assembly protein TadD